jgi:hypothetical protein
LNDEILRELQLIRAELIHIRSNQKAFLSIQGAEIADKARREGVTEAEEFIGKRSLDLMNESNYLATVANSVIESLEETEN